MFRLYVPSPKWQVLPLTFLLAACIERASRRSVNMSWNSWLRGNAFRTLVATPLSRRRRGFPDGSPSWPRATDKLCVDFRRLAWNNEPWQSTPDLFCFFSVNCWIITAESETKVTHLISLDLQGRSNLLTCWWRTCHMPAFELCSNSLSDNYHLVA